MPPQPELILGHKWEGLHPKGEVKYGSLQPPCPTKDRQVGMVRGQVFGIAKNSPSFRSFGRSVGFALYETGLPNGVEYTSPKSRLVVK